MSGYTRIVGVSSGGCNELASGTPDVPSYRTVLAHEYFDIDLAEVWAAFENELPTLEASILTPPPAIC